jgi:hypothetical protein
MAFVIHWRDPEYNHAKHHSIVHGYKPPPE